MCPTSYHHTVIFTLLAIKFLSHIGITDKTYIGNFKLNMTTFNSKSEKCIDYFIMNHSQLIHFK